MNARLALPFQWSITLLLGLFLGYTYQPMTVISAPVVATPTNAALIPTPSPTPIILPGGLLVRVKFFRNDIPQVEKMIRLDQMRSINFPPGNDRIEILNQSGQVLYSQSFLIEFLDGDPPRPVDSKTVIFVLPSTQGAAEIVITTSNGKVNYDVPAK